MLGTLINALKVTELRSRIGFVFFAFAVFILAIHITVPGVNHTAWNHLMEQGALFQFLGMFTGGALNNFSIVAMGITPYINASIIMQLLGVVIPKIQELQKEGGDLGRRKIGTYTRLLTIALAILQGTMMVTALSRATDKQTGFSVFYIDPSSKAAILYYVTVVISLTAGTAFLMWLGEQITDKGIGNGVSLLIFGGIVLVYPDYVYRTFQVATANGPGFVFNLIVFGIIAVGLIMGIIMINQGQRKVPVQYPKRVVGRRVYGGTSSYIPIRVNNAGVISIIFAISILYLPTTILHFWIEGMKGHTYWYTGILTWSYDHLFQTDAVLHNIAYALLVILFTYFYAAITFNIADVADNMKKSGGFIPGIRPGPKTAEYLDKILSRVTFVAAIFLAFIAVAPTYVANLTGVKEFFLGSTSLLIIVGVALDTMQQIEARLVMRHYRGFMQ